MNQPAVDLQDLAQAAYLVKAAYVKPNLPAGNTQGIVAYDPVANHATVTCAGSNDRQDWGDNFNFFRRKYLDDRGAARVSQGFWNHAATFGMAVLGRLKEIGVPDNATIEFQGHSLGGIAITLAVCETPRFNRPENILTTFGAPKGGNQGWVNHFHAKCRVRLLRVVREGDPVPNLPLTANPLSWIKATSPWWRHVGMEYRLPDVEGGFDHPIDSYIASIGALIQNS